MGVNYVAGLVKHEAFGLGIHKSSIHVFLSFLTCVISPVQRLRRYALLSLKMTTLPVFVILVTLSNGLLTGHSSQWIFLL